MSCLQTRPVCDTERGESTRNSKPTGSERSNLVVASFDLCELASREGYTDVFFVASHQPFIPTKVFEFSGLAAHIIFRFLSTPSLAARRIEIDRF